MGPCLTDAAPEAAPGEPFVEEAAMRIVEEAAMRKPEHQPQRSLRQSASVGSCPPLYSM
jgi:hypothetical protein